MVTNLAWVEIFVSSAKRLVSDGMLGGGGSGKSDSMALNKMGLRTEPCGSPFVNGRLPDIDPYNRTHMERPLRKLFSHNRTFPRMFILDNLYNNPVIQVEG